MRREPKKCSGPESCGRKRAYPPEVMVPLRKFFRLAPDRAKTALKGRAATKPGTLLTSKIQIRTGTEWADARPGFLEIDLVAHCGNRAKGEYCNTLEDIVRSLLFPLLGIDSDNGSEFINDELYHFCRDNGVTFTRSRAYRKTSQESEMERGGGGVQRRVH